MADTLEKTLLDNIYRNAEMGRDGLYYVIRRTDDPAFRKAVETQLMEYQSIMDEAEEKLGEAGVQPHHIEGKTTGWIVLDYGSVIIHVFSRDQREFYALDKMWSDGEQIDLSGLLTESEGD